jgi:hypothetical protein
MRTKYWSESKIGKWLYGTDVPEFLTGEEWNRWNAEVKSQRPIRYWIANTLLDKIQDFVNWPLDKLYELKYYAINRWIDQTHALVAHPKHIKPGQYMDLSERILYCLFDELVDFVEIELAYHNFRWTEEKAKQLSWWQGGKWRTRTWRSREAGMDYLEWASDLTDAEFIPEGSDRKPELTFQATCAREIRELYLWWTEIRPKRFDPYDRPEFDNPNLFTLNEVSAEDKKKRREFFDRVRKLETDHMNEDQEMLIRLVKIRKGLWT